MTFCSLKLNPFKKKKMWIFWAKKRENRVKWRKRTPLVSAAIQWVTELFKFIEKVPPFSATILWSESKDCVEGTFAKSIINFSLGNTKYSFISIKYKNWKLEGYRTSYLRRLRFVLWLEKHQFEEDEKEPQSHSSSSFLQLLILMFSVDFLPIVLYDC